MFSPQDTTGCSLDSTPAYFIRQKSKSTRQATDLQTGYEPTSTTVRKTREHRRDGDRLAIHFPVPQSLRILTPRLMIRLRSRLPLEACRRRFTSVEIVLPVHWLELAVLKLRRQLRHCLAAATRNDVIERGTVQYQTVERMTRITGDRGSYMCCRTQKVPPIAGAATCRRRHWQRRGAHVEVAGWYRESSCRIARPHFRV